VYRNVIVAVDGSELAEKALPHAESVARRYGARLRLLRAVIPLERVIADTAQLGLTAAHATPAVDAAEIVDAERDEAGVYLARLAERFRAMGIAVETSTPEGPPEQAILEASREWPADLIVMTTHGRTGLGRLVFGSVAEAVLRSAPCPVLLVRVAEAEG
jgi:nucleotide-binding universal stress UspA family protein